ncbi:netrin/laminin-related [Holotrichia oblita]|uniref:Netrin/laminin-related n=1 Tax=Holotrichia oblita TaxID=644536 RepID=A0ACB9TH74_HOLOL|nr:netrin/laminin-related [Holotrichia oblita]
MSNDIGEKIKYVTIGSIKASMSQIYEECEDCTKPGHICDPKTGRCVCPPNSHGIHCEKCLSNTWGHEPEIGCKKCNCSKFGTKKTGCDIKTGQCSCDTPYSGQNCDKCANGYYGYPKCRPCNCNKAGTHCTDHLCQCNENGQCPCKTNVIGKACDQCKEETFGLDMSNPNGCTECFCFGRSTKCTNAAYTWDQIPSNQIISDNLTQKFNSLYWRLPPVFKGDRLLSYNGYLRFKIESGSNNLPRIRNDPLVILEGNRLTIHRNLPSSLILQKYEVQLQENMWRTHRNTKVSRMDFMVLLQNVTDIYIKASDAIVRENSVLLQEEDIAFMMAVHQILAKLLSIILLVALFPANVTDDQTHAIAKLNCTDHTAGDKCEKCAEGFHGSPNEICRPCPCPTTERNFAIGCDVGRGICYCKPGYEGLKCEQCSEDYYGDPLEEEGSCQPCDCNPGGITRHGCDIKGQCYCRSGITGRKCSQCDKPRHILENNICVPCDDCTQKLLDQLDDMQAALHGNTSHLLYSELEPPWRQLEMFEDRYSDLAEQVKIYSAAVNQAKDVVDQANLDKRINEVEKIQKAFVTKKLKLDVLSKDINRNHNQSLNSLMGITSNKQELEDFTNYLNNFGKSHVSTREAVREGKAILKHMQHQYEKVQNINEDAIINACTSVRNVLDHMMKNNKTNELIDLNDKLTEANEFLNSLSEILMQTNHTLGQVENKNELNEERLNKLAAALFQNANITHAINTKLNATNDYIKKANKAMNEVEILLTKIVDEFLDDRIEELKTRRDKFKSYIRLLKDKLETARDHARMLDEKLQYMQDVFQKDDKQVNAEKASEAYSTIVTLLQEANETASEANGILQKLGEEIEPTDMDSLYDKVYIMSANASQLENRILNILNLRSQEVKDRMAAIENRLNGIKNRNWDNGIKDRELNILIDQLLLEQNEVDVQGLIADAMDKSQKMKDTYKQADEINLRIRYDLKKEAEKLKNMASPEETAEIKRKINETRQQLRNTVINFTDVSFDRDEGRFKLGNDKVVSKLEELKRRVQKAKSIADGIRVSMSGPSCARSYKLSNLEPSLITNLKMRFTLNKPSPDKLYSMFLLANNEGQFIQLVVIKNSVKFLIKLQKEEKELEMNLSDDNINLSIERFYNTVTMTVNNKTTNAVLKHGNVRFDVNPTNLVYVGNASSMAGLPGCIHDITFNGKNIGLWEFEQTTSCQGCSRSTIISSSTQIYRFNGEGFAMIKKNPVKTPQDLYISFWFKTFDENAILFLSPHTESSSYLALTLHDGHLQYEVHYNGDEIPPVILKTQEKYNDGEKHLIILTKVYENKIEHSKLKVDSSVDQHSTNINGSLLLKVKKTNFSVGGVAPDYFIDSKNVTYSLHTHQSFLGDIENFQVITSIIQLHETSEALNQYGVQLTNKPLEFRKAWFEGAGYLKLKKQSVKLENFSIIFLVRTVDDNSLLMEIENLTIFSIKEGYINVDIDGKSLHSKFKINDDEFHVIELLNKNVQDYILRIDGSKADKREISKQTYRESASIYIGGKPRMTYENEYFNGEISDIFINSKLIKFGTSTIDSFAKVKIGHSKPKVIKHPVEDTMVKDNLRSRVLTDPTDNPKDQQSIDGCDRSTNNSLELNAAKFGDMSESYVKYYLKEQFWKEDFSIELDFRTFYKNGILLFAQSDLKHYNLIELKDGSVALHFVGKRKKSLNISKRLDDGEWHKLLIENKSKKRKRKLTITIDGRKEKPKKVPPNRVFGDVFIGGIPQNVQQKLPKQLLTKLTPFKGCIKELKINQAPQSFIHHHNIGLCFSNIEKGLYFSGDAYIVYKRDFKVTSFLELKFEFRTREQNGILMSVSAINNSPALSLELQNGAVVMSVDMGNGVVSNVTNFHSAYALCDNKWHNVTALFSTELTVNVDGVSKSWVISGMGLVDNIEDPLYIGGLPDIAPAGTLKIKENFKGCIRNVKIGDNYVDWIDMEELTNVSLNSCPVA